MTGFEPVTSSLPRKRSTPELHRLKIFRAGDRVRTGDIQLGRLTLYQLSYSRNIFLSYPLNVGRAGFEPAKLKNNRFTVCPRWPLEYLPSNNYSFNIFKNMSRWRDSNPRPADYKSAALAS